MRYIIAAAVGAVMSAGAAQAAVYQYDVTMELTSLSVNQAQGWSDVIPDVQVPGTQCTFDGYEYTCRGILYFTENRFDVDFLAAYTPAISGTFRLDTGSNGYASDNPDMAATCSGSNVICDVLSYDLNDILQVASSDSFSVRAIPGYLNYEVSNNGLLYQDDSIGTFTVGGVTYDYYNGIAAYYTTTDLEIAPVPLPASLPLLAVGLAAVGFVCRRRRS